MKTRLSWLITGLIVGVVVGAVGLSLLTSTCAKGRKIASVNPFGLMRLWKGFDRPATPPETDTVQLEADIAREKELEAHVSELLRTNEGYQSIIDRLRRSQKELKVEKAGVVSELDALKLERLNRFTRVTVGPRSISWYGYKGRVVTNGSAGVWRRSYKLEAGVAGPFITQARGPELSVFGRSFGAVWLDSSYDVGVQAGIGLRTSAFEFEIGPGWSLERGSAALLSVTWRRVF